MNVRTGWATVYILSTGMSSDIVYFTCALSLTFFGDPLPHWAKFLKGAWSSFSQVQMCQPSLCLVSRHDKMLQELEVQLASQMLASNVSFPPSSGSQMLSVVFVLISQYVTGLWISVEI